MKLDPAVRAEALAQIKRRAGAQFNWKSDDPKTDRKCERLYRRAVKRARYYYRLHQSENLPKEGNEDIDAEMQDALDWQDTMTLEAIASEHEHTLLRCFMPIGVQRLTAAKILEYIIAKEAQSED